MTREEKEKMDQLCRLIQTEKDQKKFSELIVELNKLLDKKTERLSVPLKSSVPSQKH